MRALIEQYARAFEKTWDAATPVGEVRFLCLDTESTGTDPEHDFLVEIAAVAVCDGEMVLPDYFEALIRRPFNDANVTLHGITRETAATAGEPVDRALAQFFAYALDGVLVGHHVYHDIAMLSHAGEKFFGQHLLNRAIDTMELAMLLEKDGTLPPGAAPCDYSLDALCERFDIPPHGRHTAAGDAFLVAQIFLKLLPCARRAGRLALAQLCERVG